jgi:uncharacterized protein YerC
VLNTKKVEQIREAEKVMELNKASKSYREIEEETGISKSAV